MITLRNFICNSNFLFYDFSLMWFEGKNKTIRKIDVLVFNIPHMTFYILIKGYRVPGNQGTHDKLDQILLIYLNLNKLIKTKLKRYCIYCTLRVFFYKTTNKYRMYKKVSWNM